MKWETVELGDISLSIQTGPFGSQLHQSDYSDIGTPVVMPKDLVNGKIDELSIARVDDGRVERLGRHKIKLGDIIYSRRGDVGKCAYATSKEEGWLCGTGCLKVSVDEKRADAKFVFYQLQLPSTVGWVVNHAVGSTMLNLNTSILSHVPITLPSLQLQSKIVSILSVYDDLIENNQKQIKLLEEAAQRLYMEWFVDLRFPGHENVKIVDGVPEGWENTSIGAFIKVKSGFAFKSKDWVNVGYPVVKIKDIHCNTIDTSDLSCVSFETVNGLDKYKLYKNDVVVAMTGATIGKVAIIPDLANLYVNQRVGKFFADNQITSPTAFIYCFFSQKEIREQILALSSSSSAQPNISSIQLESFKFIGCIDVINNFCGITSPFINKIIGLVGCIDLLVEARNRLFSKLISGEIEL